MLFTATPGQQGRLDGAAVLRPVPDPRGGTVGAGGEPDGAALRRRSARRGAGCRTALRPSRPDPSSCGHRCSCPASCCSLFPFAKGLPAIVAMTLVLSVTSGGLPPGEHDDHGRPRVARAPQDRVRPEPPRDQPRHERRAGARRVSRDAFLPLALPRRRRHGRWWPAHPAPPRRSRPTAARADTAPDRGGRRPAPAPAASERTAIRGCLYFLAAMFPIAVVFFQHISSHAALHGAGPRSFPRPPTGSSSR